MASRQGFPEEASATRWRIRAVRQSDAMWLLLTGGRIDAAEALRIGLVSKVVPFDGQMALAPVSSSTRGVLDDLLQSVGATPQVVVECNSIAVAVALAARSDIATVLSEYAVSLSENLKMIPIESPTPVRTSGLLWRRSAQSNPLVNSFAAVIRELQVDSRWLRRRSPASAKIVSKPR